MKMIVVKQEIFMLLLSLVLPGLPAWIIKTGGRWSDVGGPVRVQPVSTNNIYLYLQRQEHRRNNSHIPKY